MSSVSQEADVRRRLEPGTRIGQLLVRSVLGQGGTAVVYEAVHTRLRSAVALKVALAPKSTSEDCALRLEREARVCAMLDDPRIPKVFDIGELEDGRPYLVMEKVSGTTVEELLARGPIAPELSVSIVCEVARALEIAHRANVVHRDLKPSNVIVQQEGDEKPRVHLMDFGISKARALHVCDVALTSPGALVGTPPYMAPEQLLGEGLDPRTDIYALGVLLYEMLSGQLPFSGHSTAEVVAAVMRRDHTPLEILRPELARGLLEIVARAMAERPSERFASARDMCCALEALEAPASADPVALPLRQSEAPNPSASRRAWFPLATAAACGVAVAIGALELSARVMPVVSASAPAPASAPLAAPETALMSVRAPDLPPPLASTPTAPRPRAPGPVEAPPRAPVRPQAARTAAPQPVAPAALLEASLRELQALHGVLDAASQAPALPSPLPDNPFVD